MAPAQAAPSAAGAEGAARLCGGEAGEARLRVADGLALRLGVRAVELACALTSSVQGAIAASGDASSKADASPVTVADYGAQALVSASLAAAYGPPADTAVSLVAEETAEELKAADSDGAILAEVARLVNAAIRGAGEGGDSQLLELSEAGVLKAVDRGGSAGGASGEHWILDPIDGTKGFLRGEQYAVALALMREGELAVGVMGCPNYTPPGAGWEGGSVVYAARGAGAWAAPLGTGGANAIRLRCDGAAAPVEARVAESHGTSVVSAHGVTAQVADRMGLVRPPLQMDSMAKYAAVAAGDAHVYMRFRPADYREKVWDHAAGAVIAQESGCVVSDCDGAPLDFSRGRFLDVEGGIVAAPPALHGAALDAADAVDLPARPAAGSV